MKYQWRITKYDPKLRDENGAFIDDDWTMLQQIGETFMTGSLLVKIILQWRIATYRLH
jgi:hypothetical protein